MPSRIYKATIRKDGNIREISIEQMSEQLYIENKAYLFCANPNCNARIVYVNTKAKNRYPHFRTRRYKQGENSEVIEQHVENCNYAVERSEIDIYRAKGDKSVIVQLSPKHIKDSLKRASRQSKIEDGTLTVSTRKTTRKKSPSRRSRVDETSIRGGTADFRTSLDEEQKNKEPRIPHCNADNIAEKYYGKSIIIRGEIERVVLAGEENSKYPYILLKSKEEKLTRILFSEYYQVHNEVQYNQIKYYKKYCEEVKKSGKKVSVACAGEVIKDDFLFSIIMISYEFIVINDLSHYEIINQYIMK